MISVPTYTATIYCGLKHGYDGEIQPLVKAMQVVQDFVNRVRLGVTTTPTFFQYVDGSEPGIIVGLLNYPRFPSTSEKIRANALELAAILKDKLGQHRISVVFPDETVMLGDV